MEKIKEDYPAGRCQKTTYGQKKCRPDQMNALRLLSIGTPVHAETKEKVWSNYVENTEVRKLY